MSGNDVQVVTEQLRARARAIQALDWPDFDGQSRVTAPSGLQLSDDAAENVWQNARGLRQYQTVGKNEAKRLTETLENVAKAYEAVDAASKQAIDSGQGTVQPVTPEPSPTPALPKPFPIAPAKPLTCDFCSDPLKAEAKLAQKDQAASLLAAAEQWATQAAQLAIHAEQYNLTGLEWAGDAAEAADARFRKFSDWLDNLAKTWGLLAGEAAKVALAHKAARARHTEVADQYRELENMWKDLVMRGGMDSPALVRQIEAKMKGLQETSEAIINTYHQNASTTSQIPEDIPESAAPPAVTASGAQGGPGAGRSGQGPGGNGPATGGPPPGAPGAPQTPATTPASAQQDQGAPAGGAPGGGSPSGGSPSGGSPAGGGTPGGLPGGVPGGKPGDIPDLPDDPNLSPASAGGGSGGGAGGGGGGMPLSPSVGGVAVGPAPAGGAAAPAGTAPAGAAGAGGMGGGMGGMGHGGGHNQGKEKRRDPNLAPDETLYEEDRAWTEAVIGNRRRRDVQDSPGDGRDST